MPYLQSFSEIQKKTEYGWYCSLLIYSDRYRSFVGHTQLPTINCPIAYFPTIWLRDKSFARQIFYCILNCLQMSHLFQVKISCSGSTHLYKKVRLPESDILFRNNSIKFDVGYTVFLRASQIHMKTMIVEISTILRKKIIIRSAEIVRKLRYYVFLHFLSLLRYLKFSRWQNNIYQKSLSRCRFTI